MRKNRKIYPPNHWLLLGSLMIFILAAILAYGVKSAWSVPVFFFAFVPAVRWFRQISKYMFRGFSNAEVAAFIVSTPVWISNQQRGTRG